MKNWIALLFACALASPSLAQTTSAISSVRDISQLTLMPGDVLRIAVLREAELSCECVIAADGSITHPLYKELHVAGVPLGTVETQIRTLLGKYQQVPAFTVTPLLRVIVAGEVHTPNLMTVPAGTTVAQAIALAGGPTDRAKLGAIRLVRTGGSRTLNLTDPETASSSAELHSGDEVLVPRSRSVMQDVIAPSSSILGALAAVTGVIIQVTRKR